MYLMKFIFIEPIYCASYITFVMLWYIINGIEMILHNTFFNVWITMTEINIIILLET